jgi:sn-glycerol 3-phosphate transport system substrate-binding protein
MVAVDAQTSSMTNPRETTMKLSHLIGAAVAAMMLPATSAWAQAEVQWWHAMGGTNGERVNKIAEDFNATQSE